MKKIMINTVKVILLVIKILTHEMFLFFFGLFMALLPVYMLKLTNELSSPLKFVAFIAIIYIIAFELIGKKIIRKRRAETIKLIHKIEADIKNEK